MNFNSIEYIVFLCITLVMFYSVPIRYRYYILVVASAFFYGRWNPRYLLLILSVILVSYIAGGMIEKATKPYIKKLIMSGAILIIVSLLFYYKYFNFLIQSFIKLFTWAGINHHFELWDIILPVGISFFSFQAMGYIIDIYRGEEIAEHSLMKYMLYIMFFPQLVAGPIESSRDFIPQIYKPYVFDSIRFESGLKKILMGLCKKIVIADNVAIFVDAVYASPTSYNGLLIFGVTILFSLQIYCDFSGYSDIAIGSAELLGYKLTKNFDGPYFAKSIKDFWGRWHISLTRWLTRYIYYPLGGGHVKKWRKYLNILIVFLVSGLWHGAGWNFIIWGGLNGLLRILEETTAVKKISCFVEKKHWGIVRVPITFFIVNVLWIFFRANNLSEVKAVLEGCFSFWSIKTTAIQVWDIFQSKMTYSFSLFFICMISIFIALVILVCEDYLERVEKSIWMISGTFHKYVIAIVMTLLVVVNYSVQHGMVDWNAGFIYFQF